MAYRYRETISFHPVVQILYLFMLAVVCWSLLAAMHDLRQLLIMAIVGLLVSAIALVFGRLVIEVDELELRATWGYLGWPRRVFPLSAIHDIEVVQYRPLRQFGGWGIRCGRIDGQTTMAYTVRGNRGVRFSLTEEIRVGFVSTRSFLIGSLEPERLQQALGR